MKFIKYDDGDKESLSNLSASKWRFIDEKDLYPTVKLKDNENFKSLLDDKFTEALKDDNMVLVNGLFDIQMRDSGLSLPMNG